MREKELKEKWSKPKLIILTRGKPEERVLVTCKYFSIVPTSPAIGELNCENPGCPWCNDYFDS